MSDCEIHSEVSPMTLCRICYGKVIAERDELRAACASMRELLTQAKPSILCHYCPPDVVREADEDLVQDIDKALDSDHGRLFLARYKRMAALPRRWRDYANGCSDALKTVSAGDHDARHAYEVQRAAYTLCANELKAALQNTEE